MKRTQMLARFAGGSCLWTSNAFRVLLLGGNLPSKLKDMKIIPLRSSETFFQIQSNDVWSTPCTHFIPKSAISDHAKTWHFHNMCFYIQGL